MIELDDQLFSAADLADLPWEHRSLLRQAVYQELETRVGAVIARHATRRQLDAFEAHVRSRDEAGALAWLQQNYPRYRDVVAAESEKLGAELASSGAEIAALSVLYQTPAMAG
jgi:predicted RNA-binding Zn ribbon-like protein